MARMGCPPEFRRRVIDLVEGGRKVAEVAVEFEVSEQAIYTWRRQARIDAGLWLPGKSGRIAAVAFGQWARPCGRVSPRHRLQRGASEMRFRSIA